MTFKKAGYHFPEQVGRLCVPDADLSAFATTPVKSRMNVFYRYAGERGYELVDVKGSGCRNSLMRVTVFGTGETIDARTSSPK